MNRGLELFFTFSNSPFSADFRSISGSDREEDQGQGHGDGQKKERAGKGLHAGTGGARNVFVHDGSLLFCLYGHIIAQRLSHKPDFQTGSAPFLDRREPRVIPFIQ